jgi:hypothetical protein
LVEGENDLLTSIDTDVFHEGVYPTNIGFQLIADRLKPRLKQILLSLDK